MKSLENILFIGDALLSLKLKSDSSLALAETALKQGYKVFWCEPQNICYFNQEIFVYQCEEIISVNVHELNYKKHKENMVSFSFFHVCFIRKDPPFNEEYKDLCWILSTQTKVKIFNSAESLLSFHEKSLHWRAYAEGVLNKEQIIPTCLTHHIAVAKKFCDQFPADKKFIWKPWLGHGGEDITLFENKKFLLEYLEVGAGANDKGLSERLKQFIIQPFLEEITTEGDRRVMVANGQVVFDYVRLPAPGKIASNGAQGGSAVLRDMTAEQSQICEKLAKFLQAKNIVFAGIDLIGTYVGEINITSPTGIRTFESLANLNVADKIFSLLMDE